MIISFTSVSTCLSPLDWVIFLTLFRHIFSMIMLQSVGLMYLRAHDPCIHKFKFPMASQQLEPVQHHTINYDSKLQFTIQLSKPEYNPRGLESPV